MELAEVDAFVLESIRGRGGDAGRTKDIEVLLHRQYPSISDPMRVVDRSLQRLKKAGKIKLATAPRRWVVV